jgi:hypothetical protein
MNKKLKIGLIVLGVILLLILLNYAGAFSSLNKYLSGTPDKSCTIDSDCVLKITSCDFCDCGDAVNKDWTVFCPFRNPPMQVLCKMCASPNHDFEVKCVENQCQRVWINK